MIQDSEAFEDEGEQMRNGDRAFMSKEKDTTSFRRNAFVNSFKLVRDRALASLEQLRDQPRFAQRIEGIDRANLADARWAQQYGVPSDRRTRDALASRSSN